MDPVTHGLIGGSAALVFSDKENFQAAAFTGFTSALLADLDILIHDSSDPLLNIEFHRQFTHSLFFIPVGALLATVLVWWFVRKKLSIREIYIFSLMGYGTSGITDAMTSYGTQLLWPFLEHRFAWNLISVFDPLFSLGILIAVIFTLYYHKKRFVYFGWVWIVFYMSLAVYQHQRTEKIATQVVDSSGHKMEKMVVKPTIGNQLLWSARYISADSVHAIGIRSGLFKDARIYIGESIPLLQWRDKYQDYKGTTLYIDIERFDRLSEGFLVEHPGHDSIIGDARYAMLPTSMKPLWGVKIDTSKASQHLPFLNFRDAGKTVRTDFIKMLKGEK